jgi:hypothetical protein
MFGCKARLPCSDQCLIQLFLNRFRGRSGYRFAACSTPELIRQGHPLRRRKRWLRSLDRSQIGDQCPRVITCESKGRHVGVPGRKVLSQPAYEGIQV